MSCVNLDAVKTGFAAEIHGFTELLHEGFYFAHFEAAMDSRGIEVKTCVGTNGLAMTGTDVRHVTAVAELDRDFGAFCMHSVREFLQSG